MKVWASELLLISSQHDIPRDIAQKSVPRTVRKKQSGKLAQALWNYDYWNRAQDLKNLVSYYVERKVTDLEGLKKWTHTSDYDRDFHKRIPNLGYASYQWIRIRMGVNTVKPDSRLKTWVKDRIGWVPADKELVRVMEKVAGEIGWRADHLDWAIWDEEE